MRHEPDTTRLAATATQEAYDPKKKGKRNEREKKQKKKKRRRKETHNFNDAVKNKKSARNKGCTFVIRFFLQGNFCQHNSFF